MNTRQRPIGVFDSGIGGLTVVRALRGVNLRIDPGEYVAIIGPSGSGKTTLMNLIGCLDTPTRGSYVLRGKLVSSMNDDELAAIRPWWNARWMPSTST